MNQVVRICDHRRKVRRAILGELLERRDRYASRVRAIIAAGCQSGRFETANPDLAAFAVLEMGNGAKSWFRPSGRYPDTYVAREYGAFALRMVGSTG